jgi:hypothetical protein
MALDREGMDMALKVLLFQEEESWIAMVLEYYIVAQGDTIEDAIYDLSRLTCGEMIMRNRGVMQPLDDVPKAPHMYWEWYGRAKPYNHTLFPFKEFDETSEVHSETPAIRCRAVGA